MLFGKRLTSMLKITLILTILVFLSTDFVENSHTRVRTIKAAVVDSQGTDYLEMTIWEELINNWRSYGCIQVFIDYASLNKDEITYEDIAATEANLLIISVAGIPYEFTDSEIGAIKQYVKEGHGIIITYDSFEGKNAKLAPLVGFSDTIALGLKAPSTISFDLSKGEGLHAIFRDVSNPYVSGVSYMTATYYQSPWPVTTGKIVASTLSASGLIWVEGVIVMNKAKTFRGVYFPHYIEDSKIGSNQYDKQVFYNAMLWVSRIPNPPTKE